MANIVTYTLNWSDSSKGSIVLDPTTINTVSSSLSLMGQGYPNYGEVQQENFLKLLENFASPNVPTAATKGQAWFDTGSNEFKIYSGTVWGAVAYKQYVDDGLNGIVSLVDNMFNSMDGLALKNLHGPFIDLLSLAPATTSGQYISPSIRMFNPDNSPEEGGTFGTHGWTNIANRDGTILQIEASTGGLAAGWDDTNKVVAFSINQDLSIDIFGALDINGHTINSLVDPVLDQQAATKKYVDVAIASGIISPTVGAGSVHTIWVPAGAMAPVLPGPAFGTVQTTTYKVILKTLDLDATVSEYGQFSVRMPKGWNRGQVHAAVVWSTTGTGTATFGVHASAFSNGDALDTAFGTIAKQSSAATPNTLRQTSIIGPITIAGAPASEDTVTFQVFRDVADANDNLTVDARLHGVVVMYTIDRLTDA